MINRKKKPLSSSRTQTVCGKKWREMGMIAEKRNGSAVNNVKISGNFVQFQCAVKTTRIFWLVWRYLPIRQSNQSNKSSTMAQLKGGGGCGVMVSIAIQTSYRADYNWFESRCWNI